MLLYDVNAKAEKLPLPEPALRIALAEGRLSELTLRGNTPHGFYVEGLYSAESGMCVPAVLVNRSGSLKTIKCPDRALQYIRKLGAAEFEVDVTDWDPGAAFNPGQGSYRSRERRRRYEEALERIAAICNGQVYCPGTNQVQRLNDLAESLCQHPIDDIGLRALTICWCDVHLHKHPRPEQALGALLRFAQASQICSTASKDVLASCCDDEFRRRCKNQHLASLDLSDAN